MPISPVETPTRAVLGWATLLQRGNEASDGGYVTVAEVTNAPLPELSRPQINVMHMQSPGANEEYIAGPGATSEQTYDCNFIAGDATQDDIDGIIHDGDNRIDRYWRLVYAQADAAVQKAFTFIGTVTGYNIPATPAEALKLNFKLTTNTRVGWSIL
jgi:hypothetical protein